MQVPCDEGLAIHIGPESCAVAREGLGEALTGVRIGQPLTDWRRAIYHHRRLVSDPNVSDKEARSAANCMVLHPAATTTRSNFTTCTGFSRTISEGSRDADRSSAGEAGLTFITRAQHSA